MSQEPCECLERWDALGIVFVYLAVLRNDPKWARPTATWKSRWVKRGKNLLFPPSARVAHTLPSERCWDAREVPQASTTLPGCFLSPGSGHLTWYQALTHLLPARIFTRCKQPLGRFSPAAISLFLLLPLLLSFALSHHSIAWKLKKIPVCPWVTRKGLLICSSFVVSDA